MSERIVIDALKPGMVILQVTQQNGPVRIRKSGLVTSDAMVTGLREMGVQELEIDPEQTVEIQSGALPPKEPSQTQFLLQSNSASGVANDRQASTQQDSQLAEQFNRSLFLPTAQEIPDTWQIYARQVGMAAAVVVLGFGLGFGAATGPDMISKASNDDSLVARVNTAQENGSEANANKMQPEDAHSHVPAEQEKAKPDVVNSDPANLAPENENTQATNASAAQPVQTSQPVEPQEPEMLVLGLQPEQSTADEALEPQDLSQNPEVSQALLKRFQQVMTEMEQNQQGDKFVPSKAPTSPAPEDVPRVDQMPQWILSSLPRLSFNAHMFATEPADRWVKVNGKELGEGDWIDGQLRIQRIDPQHIILDFQGHQFSMKALSDW